MFAEADDALQAIQMGRASTMAWGIRSSDAIASQAWQGDLGARQRCSANPQTVGDSLHRVPFGGDATQAGGTGRVGISIPSSRKRLKIVRRRALAMPALLVGSLIQ